MPHLTRDSAGTASMYSDDYSLLVHPNDPYAAPNTQQLAGAPHMFLRDDRWSSNSAPNTPILARRSSAPHTRLSDSQADRAGLENGLNDMPKPSRLRERHSLSDLLQEQRHSQQNDQTRSPPTNGILTQIANESPVLADLKTNVIVKDEFTLVTDLTYHLAQRYGRAESRILVKIDHSACLALGGAFDPCYVLTVSAVVSHVQPAANKRNALAIQAFMADILSVSAERGIVKFDPIEESNLATAGQTISGMAEQLQQRRSEDYSANPVVKRVSNNLANRKHLNGGWTANNVPEPPKQTTNGHHRPMSNMSIHNRHSRISEEAESDEEERYDSKSPTSPVVQNGSQFRPQTSDGLRMNGLSNEAPSSRHDRASNGRPTTSGTRLTYTQNDDSQDDRSTRGLTATATKTTMAKGTARQVQTANLRAEQKSLRSSGRTSSLGGGAVLDSAEAPASPVIPASPDGGPERFDSKLDARAAESRASMGATASPKRRSTIITATPMVPPVMPPEPKPDLAYSIRETRSLRETTRNLFGKRKSFLKAFSKRQQQQAAGQTSGEAVY